MRKQVRKQIEKMRAVERDRYRTACTEIRLLKLKVAELERALHVTKGHASSLEAMFEELQVCSVHDLQVADDEIKHLKSINGMLCDTIDKLKQPWWRRWFRRGIEGKKGS